MIYLVATPIGHLGDFSLRAQETLQNVAYILCEDTRVSQVLLSRYGIVKPLKAFHKFNETKLEETVIQDLKQGASLALISDAGTPGISDPGEKLIHRCLQEGIAVQSIPGPTALISALILSGLPTTPFQFVGFLPKKPGEYRRALETILTYPGTTILYESPHRLKTLLAHLPPQRALSISRELTKKFEETLRGTAATLLPHFETHPPRGEFVIVIAPGTDLPPAPPTLQEAYAHLTLQGLSKSQAIRALAQQFQRTKKEIEQSLF